jgi:hypothetical protein
MTIKTEQRVYNNLDFNVSNAFNVQLLVLHMHTCIDFQYMTKFALTYKTGDNSLNCVLKHGQVSIICRHINTYLLLLY